MDEMEHSVQDSDKFFKAMWRSLKDVLLKGIQSAPSSSARRGAVAEYTNSLMNSIRDVKDAKKYMREIWEQSKTFRISDKIHMTEVQVRRRRRCPFCLASFLKAEINLAATAGPPAAQGRRHVSVARRG